jgi:hypothetical protein
MQNDLLIDRESHRNRQLEIWVTADLVTMQMLRLVRDTAPPCSFLAAGAIRNLAWDRLHGYPNATPLHDVDVVYHDTADLSGEKEQEAERKLHAELPGIRWQVRNQARMHVRNGEPPYLTVERAMKGWPETATAVGVRLLNDNTLEWLCPWGLSDLFHLKLRPSPLCADPEAFARRVQEKDWLRQWPKLSVAHGSVL